MQHTHAFFLHLHLKKGLLLLLFLKTQMANFLTVGSLFLHMLGKWRFWNWSNSFPQKSNIFNTSETNNSNYTKTKPSTKKHLLFLSQTLNHNYNHHNPTPSNLQKQTPKYTQKSKGMFGNYFFSLFSVFKNNFLFLRLKNLFGNLK